MRKHSLCKYIKALVVYHAIPIAFGPKAQVQSDLSTHAIAEQQTPDMLEFTPNSEFSAQLY